MWPLPTAVQAVADVHDTPAREMPRTAPEGAAVGWIVQLVPSQTSASALPSAKPLPTAVQAVADVHDTPDRVLSVPPVGFGVGWIVQLVPSHRSAKVRSCRRY